MFRNEVPMITRKLLTRSSHDPSHENTTKGILLCRNDFLCVDLDGANTSYSRYAHFASSRLIRSTADLLLFLGGNRQGTSFEACGGNRYRVRLCATHRVNESWKTRRGGDLGGRPG